MDVLTHREWLQLRKQFRKMMPVKCRYPECIKFSDPQCHGYSEFWAYARYCVHMNKWNPQ